MNSKTNNIVKLEASSPMAIASHGNISMVCDILVCHRQIGSNFDRIIRQVLALLVLPLPFLRLVGSVLGRIVHQILAPLANSLPLLRQKGSAVGRILRRTGGAFGSIVIHAPPGLLLPFLRCDFARVIVQVLAPLALPPSLLGLVGSVLGRIVHQILAPLANSLPLLRLVGGVFDWIVGQILAPVSGLGGC